MVTLLVWWLLVAGSFLNLIIYTLLNDNMRHSLSLSFRMLAYKLGLGKDDPIAAAASRAGNRSGTTTTKTTSLVNKHQRSKQETAPLKREAH